MVLEIDGFKQIEQRHDRVAIEWLLRIVGERLQDGLRDGDTLARLDGACFGLALSSRHQPDLETAIQLGQRLQAAVADPIPVEGLQIHVTVSLGFALALRLVRTDGADLVQAATLALIEAQRGGSNSIRC